MGDKLTVCGKEYELLRLLGRGKGGYSYLASDGGTEVVLKQIHHEPCAYYSFGNKIEAERFDHERLERAGIRMPRLLALDAPAERIVKEYIAGPTVFELLRDGLSAEPYLPQVRAMAERARAAGLNIDYFPANFVVRDGLLWYVDYECNAYADEWNFENWGVRYWSRTPEFEAALRERVSFRPYTEADYEAVCEFLAALVRADESRVNWNWARFEWMAEHPEFDKSLISSIGLWCEDGRVVGAAIYDMYFGEAFCGALPSFGFLVPEILDYAYRELKDGAGLGVAVCDEDAAGIRALREAGFERAEQDETIMEKDLRTLPDEAAALPEGVRLTELDPTQEDLKDVQWLFWQGFDHGSDRAAFEADFAKTAQDLRPRRHFDPSLSLAARDPSGELISYCCLWVRPGTGYAYVEPVCTIPAWRGKGIAGALLQEAFRRAKALGAEKAFVISDQAFYEKLGFRKKYHYTFYWKTMKLVEPSPEYKQQIRAYRQAFLGAGDSMDGTGGLRKFEDPRDWIADCARYRDPLTVPEGRVPATQYMLVREADRKIIGMIQIRHYFNEYLEQYGGHIGYSVAPDERRKGYAAQMLRLALPKCRELGLEKVLITCISGNEGSKRTILKNGGVYECTVYEPEEGIRLERYWIDLSR